MEGIDGAQVEHDVQVRSDEHKWKGHPLQLPARRCLLALMIRVVVVVVMRMMMMMMMMMMVVVVVITVVNMVVILVA